MQNIQNVFLQEPCKMELEMDQAQILEDLRKGGSPRERAVSLLYTQLFPKFMAHLKCLGCTPHKAEDCIQETFIKVLRNLPQFRGDAQLSTWMRTILDNTWRDSQRSAFESKSTDLDSAGVEEMADEHHPHASLSLEQDQLSECVRLGYRRFRDKYPGCAAGLYQVMEGASIAEMAAAAGRTQGAMREHLSQCRKKLMPFVERCRRLLPT